jgi:methionyl-tRNA formyltransferase
MRVVFVGAVKFSDQALRLLVTMKVDILGVCTLETSVFNADHCDLSAICVAQEIPCIYAPDINSDEVHGWISEKKPDVIFCFGWSRLIKQRLLNAAPLGVIGFHPAALPANRGRHPLIWALVLGLKRTASTFFFMDESADGGDILSQVGVDIDVDDSAGSLYEKITHCALQQIAKFVPQLSSGAFPRIPQDHRLANVWRKRGRADGQIDWRMSSQAIRNLVRGLSKPYVGAHFVYRGGDIKVWDTRLMVTESENIEPGKIIEKTHEGCVVACGDGAILLLNTEPNFAAEVGEYL